MPFNFETEDEENPLDGLDTEVSEDEAAGEVYEDLTEPEVVDEPTPEAEQEFDAQIREVEDRLQTAQYYKLLLDDSLFDVGTPAGRQVDSEIKAFVRERLGFLMGMGAPKVAPVRVIEAKPQFNEQETAALKLVAKLCIEKNATKLAAAKPEKAPKAEPALKKPKAAEPKPAPEPVKVAAPPKPAPKPKAQATQAPGLKKPSVPASVRKPLAQAQPQVKGTPAGPKPRAQDGRIPKKYRDDPSARVDKQGRVTIHARNDDGQVILNTEGKPMLKYVTEPAVPPPHIKPMPQPNDMQAAMRATEQGQVALQAASRRYQGLGLGNLVQTAIVTPPSRPTAESEEEYQ